MKIQLNKILWGYAFLIIGLAYFFGLFIDLTGDSGLYAAISRQMAESGDWFNLKNNGLPYDQKPHLFFWLAGAGIQLFGNTNFAFKLFPFLYGLLGIYFTYRFGKQLFSVEVGKLAALIAGTSQIYFLYFFDYHTDIVLQTGVVLALWQLAAYLQNRKALNFVLGFFGIGLAMLTKGPVGAILPFFAVLFYLLIKRDFRQLFHPKWILGVVMVLVIISPSLIHLYNSFGIKGLTFYFITNNIGRITGEYAGSSSDPFFYLHTLLWAVLPWTIWVVFAIISEIKSWFTKEGKEDWGIYLLGSVLILVVIFSVAKGKAPNYFLIAITPISVIAARWISRFADLSTKMQKVLVRSQYFIVGLLTIIFIFITIVFSEHNYWLPVLLLLLSLSAAVYFIKTQNNSLQKVIFISVIIVGTLNLFLNVKVFPDLYKYQGARLVLEIFEKNHAPNEKLYNLHLAEYELFFYSKNKVTQINSSEEYYEILEKKGTWVYTTEAGYKGILGNVGQLDTVICINQRGMNKSNFGFINPKTRSENLKTKCLFRIPTKSR